jgi:phosphonate transport system ATP-binding protein
MDLLLVLNQQQGMTLIVSLHHVGLAQRYCQRVVALRDGAVVFDGPSSALTPGFLRELYGGAADELLLDGTPSETQDAWSSPMSAAPFSAAPLAASPV